MRLLVNDGKRLLGLTEARSAPSGAFSVQVAVPEGMAPGTKQVLAVAMGTPSLSASDLDTPAPLHVPPCAPMAVQIPARISGRAFVRAEERNPADQSEIIVTTEPLQDAVVALGDIAGNVVATTATDPAGRYSFTNLAPGSYRVASAHPLYDDLQPSSTSLPPGAVAIPAVVLPIGGIALSPVVILDMKAGQHAIDVDFATKTQPAPPPCTTAPSIWKTGGHTVPGHGALAGDTTPIDVMQWKDIGPYRAGFGSLPGRPEGAVWVRFTADIQTCEPSNAVRFTFLHGGNKVVFQHEASAPDDVVGDYHPGINSATYSAALNVGDLPPGEITVRIRLEDADGYYADDVEYTLAVEDLHARWFGKYGANSTMAVITDPVRNVIYYYFQGGLGTYACLCIDLPLDAVIHEFQNNVTVQVSTPAFQEAMAFGRGTDGGNPFYQPGFDDVFPQFSGNQPIYVPAYGSPKVLAFATAGASNPVMTAQVTLLDINMLDSVYELKPINVGGAVARYEVYRPNAINQAFPPIPLYRNGPGVACVDLWVTEVCGGWRIEIDFTIAGAMDAGAAVQMPDGQPEITVTPKVSGTLSGFARAAVWPFVDAQANASGTITVALPFKEPGGLQGWCVILQGQANLDVSLIAGLVDFGAGGSIGPYPFGDSCQNVAFYRVDGNELTYLGAALAGRQPGQQQSFRTAPQPAVAADRSGQALAVWVADTAGAPGQPKPVVASALFDGMSWRDTGAVTSGEALIGSPSVAYLAPGRAVAVWGENREAAAASDLSAIDPAGTEIRSALWDGAGWSDAGALTDDRIGDGLPSVATDGRGGAIAAWVRRVDDGASSRTGAAGAIAWSRLDGGRWSAPATLPLPAGAADTQVRLAASPDGTIAAVWVRDLDGDLDTMADRALLLLRWDGDRWGLAETVAGIPAGAVAPSVALDPSGQPLIAFTAPTARPGEGRRGGGAGHTLWSAYRRNGTWEVTPVGENTYGEAPTLQVDAEGRAVLFFRGFAVRETLAPTGALAAAGADLNAPALRWSAGIVSDDGEANERPALAVAAGRAIAATVKRPGPGPAQTNSSPAGGRERRMATAADGAAVALLTLPLNIDLDLTEGITLSEPHPATGEQITISAILRNRGLGVAGSNQPVTVAFYEEDASGRRSPIGRQRLTMPLTFGGSARVSLPYVVSEGGLRRIVVIADPDGTEPDADRATNTANALLGRVEPPRDLEVQVGEVADEMTLRWRPSLTRGVSGYRVYRSAQPGTGYELVGGTTETSFVDRLPADGVPYHYIVTAIDGHGVRSAASNRASVRQSPTP